MPYIPWAVTPAYLPHSDRVESKRFSFSTSITTKFYCRMKSYRALKKELLVVRTFLNQIISKSGDTECRMSVTITWSVGTWLILEELAEGKNLHEHTTDFSGTKTQHLTEIAKINPATLRGHAKCWRKKKSQACMGSNCGHLTNVIFQTWYKKLHEIYSHLQFISL